MQRLRVPSVIKTTPKVEKVKFVGVGFIALGVLVVIPGEVQRIHGNNVAIHKGNIYAIYVA
jgi:hypothetical protein